MEYKLTTPVTKEMLAPLKAGDTVLLSGTVQTFHEPLVGGIPGGIDRAGEEDGITGLQRGQHLFCDGGGQFIFHEKTSLTGWRWRGGWRGSLR